MALLHAQTYRQFRTCFVFLNNDIKHKYSVNFQFDEPDIIGKQ